MFIALFDSIKFSFIAAGNTEEEARAALRAGLERHASQLINDKGVAWVDECMADANIVALKSGVCLRDFETI